MFDSGRLIDELQGLRVDVSELLNTPGEGLFDKAKDRSEALMGEIKGALSELSETISSNEEQVGKLISDRPIASLASAFALGVVVGFMLRRH